MLLHEQAHRHRTMSRFGDMTGHRLALQAHVLLNILIDPEIIFLVVWTWAGCSPVGRCRPSAPTTHRWDRQCCVQDAPGVKVALMSGISR